MCNYKLGNARGSKSFMQQQFGRLNLNFLGNKSYLTTRHDSFKSISTNQGLIEVIAQKTYYILHRIPNTHRNRKSLPAIHMTAKPCLTRCTNHNQTNPGQFSADQKPELLAKTSPTFIATRELLLTIRQQ